MAGINRFSTHERTKKLVYLAVFTALVVILSFIKITFGMFSITLTLAPIVIGAALCGLYGGAWLGFVFSLMVFVTGDAAPFLAVNPAGAVVTVILKGTLAGLCAGLVFRPLSQKNKTIAVTSAAIVAPIVNTGIFFLGCLIFFYDTVTSWGAALGYESGVSYMFLGLAGGNFLVEFAVNLILCPVIIRILDIIAKKRI